MKLTKTEPLILVPENWLIGLLEKVHSFEEAFANYEFGNVKNDRIMSKANALSGYAKSADHLIKYNERVE